MSKKLAGLSILMIAAAFVFTFSNPGFAESRLSSWINSLPEHQMRVDRDLGGLHADEVNQFGVDRAYTSTRGADRDADSSTNLFAPNTYGLMGNYWFDSNN